MAVPTKVNLYLSVLFFKSTIATRATVSRDELAAILEFLPRSVAFPAQG